MIDLQNIDQIRKFGRNAPKNCRKQKSCLTWFELFRRQIDRDQTDEIPTDTDSRYKGTQGISPNTKNGVQSKMLRSMQCVRLNKTRSTKIWHFEYLLNTLDCGRGRETERPRKRERERASVKDRDTNTIQTHTTPVHTNWFVRTREKKIFISQFCCYFWHTAACL